MTILKRTVSKLVCSIEPAYSTGITITYCAQGFNENPLRAGKITGDAIRKNWRRPANGYSLFEQVSETGASEISVFERCDRGRLAASRD